MRKAITLALTMILALAVMTGTAWGSGFHTGEYYSAYNGQALAGTTLLENAGVVGSMPAGMVRLDEGMEALGGINYYIPTFEYETLDGTDKGGTVTENILGPYGYGVYNSGSYALGLGMYFPFNVDIEYEKGWAGREDLYQETLVVGYTSLMGAFAVTDEFSVGGGINLVDAWINLKKVVIAAPGVEIPVDMGGTASTIGYKISVLYDTGNIRAGVNHSPGYTLVGKGTVQFDTSQAPGFTGQFPDGNITLELPIPSVTEIGISYRNKPENEDYLIELSNVKTGWSSYKELRITFENGLPADETVIPKNWKDTTSYRLGGSYVISRSEGATHKIRTGYFMDETPIPAETLDPAVPDGTGRTGIGLGYNYESGAMELDFSYFTVDFKEGKTTEDTIHVPAKYGGKVDIIGVSFGYQF